MEAIRRIYEDEDVVIIYKPAGVLSEGAEGSGERALPELLGEVYPVHRLDRDTAGLMIFGKNKRGAAELSEMFGESAVHKKYLAAVTGEIPERGRLEDDLFFDRRMRKSYVVSGGGRKGVKHAILEYERLAVGDGYSVAAVKLLTGRTHQIRAQMSNAGHPLIGDRRYGGKGKCACSLISAELSFDEKRIKNGYFGGRGLGAYLAERQYTVTCDAPDEYPWDILYTMSDMIIGTDLTNGE